MHFSPRAAAVATLLITAARAQDDEARTPPAWPEAELARHLAATDLAEVAWAGWFVSRDRLRKLVPDVRRALARLQGQDDLDGQLARLQLLDALLQIGVRVPGEELLPHATGLLRAPALVLAASSPQQNLPYFAARMAAEGDHTMFEWVTCGNVLATHVAPGFAAACLAEVELLMTVVVHDGHGRPPSRSVG